MKLWYQSLARQAETLDYGADLKKVISIAEETPVEQIARLMTTHGIKRLPVMRGAEVVGIVSRADIVNAIALGTHVALHTPVYDL